MSPQETTGVLFQKTDLLIIYEISMEHKHVFESIDRTMQDIRKHSLPFGGPTVLLAGDWRQILPVVRHGSRPDIVEATLKSSYLWQTVTRLQLTQNMRAKLRVDSPNQAVNGIFADKQPKSTIFKSVYFKSQRTQQNET